MNDVAALDFLSKALEKDIAVATTLGVSPQMFGNWRARGRISRDWRFDVWLLVNEHGGNLPREWLRPVRRQAA